MAAGLNGKLIISEVLCFIQNQINSTAKNDIIATCVKFYSSEEIEFEKMKFFDTIGLRAPPRRGNDQITKDLTDVIDKMLSFDHDNVVTPTFVAADLSRIPRITNNEDGSATLQQVLASMSDLKKSFKILKANVVTNESLRMALDDRDKDFNRLTLGTATPTRKKTLPEHAASPRLSLVDRKSVV